MTIMFIKVKIDKLGGQTNNAEYIVTSHIVIWCNPLFGTWSINNPPPALIFHFSFFSCFYAYFRLG